MSEYEKAKTEIVWVEDYEFPYVVTESVENLIQAADKEIEHLQDIYKLCNHDRALLQKDAATKNAELARLREALEQIIRWDGFPESGRYWEDGRAMSYSAAFGSNGERDYMRTLAQEALKSNDS